MCSHTDTHGEKERQRDRERDREREGERERQAWFNKEFYFPHIRTRY